MDISATGGLYASTVGIIVKLSVCVCVFFQLMGSPFV